MSSLRLALRSLAYHWRTNVAVALGVIAATAVLTGALAVGDSMQGSLGHLVIDRLGKIDTALVAPRFFREKLVEELAASAAVQEHFTAAVPAILLQGSIQSASGQPRHRAGNVAVIGIGAEFWQFGHDGPDKPPAHDEIVLNQPLADQLHARVGDEVILRLPNFSEVPADSPLGKKTETVRSRRFKVSAIIAAEGLGRFGLRPTQQMPLNAFTATEPVQSLVDAGARVNAILLSGRDEVIPTDAEAERALQKSLRPTLADYGFSLAAIDRGYFNFTSDRMLLEPAIVTAAMKAWSDFGVQPVFTYLANYIQADNWRGKIPYSTIAAVDFPAGPLLGPLVNREGQPIGPLKEDEIVLNARAADDLAAQGAAVKPGDKIELWYFEPESTHGEVKEIKHAFRLKDITPLAGMADDPNFTPKVKGVTDEASIANWQPPFPYDPARVRNTPPNNQDDLYWQQHRATPKGFVSLEQGRKLWGSRFGETTSIRVPSGEGVSEQSLTAALLDRLDPAAAGFAFLPVKRLGLEAAAGTTPFAVLFLGFSMFIIAAALMLVALLFKLGLDQRAEELGILLGVGIRARQVRRILLLEAICVAMVGAAIGAAAGIGYAWLMIVGLKTWWLGAISTPFLKLYITPVSLAIGFGSGVLVSLITIVWALRQLRRASVRLLLTGQMQELRLPTPRSRRLFPWIANALIVIALVTGVSAAWWKLDSRALPFFGAGALVLCALLLLVWDSLRARSSLSITSGRAPLVRLAWRNASRHPLRSTLTIGLTAAACFLITALGAFQLSTSRNPPFRGGEGGFALVAQSDQPIYQDLASPEGRRELSFSPEKEQIMFDAQRDMARIFSLRVQPGDDASCLNLYQPRQPRILGVPQAMLDRGGFLWTGVFAKDPMQENNPWLALNPNRKGKAAEQPADAPIPVVLDQNTALYSLHLSGEPGEVFEIDRPGGGKLKLQVVGLLKNSIFQGDLLVNDEDFLRLFPDSSGFRFFLIAAAPEEIPPIANALNSTLNDYGFSIQTTQARLNDFFAVQNTYLSTFRSLGGLGLLLGTFGLATVQLRSIVERRGELALLRATGFRRRRLAQMVLLENATLLIAGLGCGALAALVALLPHLFARAAGFPWLTILATLCVIFVAGLLAGLLVVRAVLRAPLVPALRGE